MSKPTITVLAARVLDEMKRTHHNGSLLGVHFNYPDNADMDSLDAYIEFCAQEEIADIEDDINKKFGLHWKLERFGRNGATVAPLELYNDNCDGFGGVDFTIDVREYRDLDGYNELRKMLGALTLLNDRCEAWCNSWNSRIITCNEIDCEDCEE